MSFLLFDSCERLKSAFKLHTKLKVKSRQPALSLPFLLGLRYAKSNMQDLQVPALGAHCPLLAARLARANVYMTHGCFR